MKILRYRCRRHSRKTSCDGADRPAEVRFRPQNDPRPNGRRSKEAFLRLEVRRSLDRLSRPGAHNRPVAEPRNLGSGWIGFRFEKAFGCPVKIVNAAAMQALGSYRGVKMFFLGLGTTMIVDGNVEPMSSAISLTKRRPTRITWANEPSHISGKRNGVVT